jgi:GT2 family glycosyltransferase
VGLAAASSLITRLDGDHRLDTIRYRREVATEIQTASYVYAAFTQVLRQVQPDRVYLFNGRFSTVLPALNACEELNVPYATHERGGSMDRYWVGHNVMPHDVGPARAQSDAVWAMHSEAEAGRGAAFFTSRRHRMEASSDSFTTAQADGTLPAGFDSGRKNVAIFNSSMEECAAIRSWPRPILVYHDEVDALRAICTAFAGDPGYHFYLRAHPRLSGRDNTQTRDLRSLDGCFENLTVVPPDSTVDSYALLDRSAAIVTFGSTMGVEACFWGRPSIRLGRAYYEELDCAYAPETHEEVVALLRSDLPPKPRANALKYGLWVSSLGERFTRYVPESLTRGTFDGERIADARPARSGARFSVVIPTRNRAPQLRRCLDSLVAQTWPHFEVLVCDDGSTDDSREVVEDFAGRLDVRYCWYDAWGGPARPRNMGIALAKEDWICFLDSDDWWYPTKLEACLPHVETQDVIFHDLETVSAEGPTGVSIGRDVTSPVFVDLITNLNAIANSAAVVRTRLLRQVGGVSENREIVGAEDFDLWLRLAQRTERFHRVPQTLGARLDIGRGHNLSASPSQIERELRVFERYRDSLSGLELWQAWRNWKHRRHDLGARA